MLGTLPAHHNTYCGAYSCNNNIMNFPFYYFNFQIRSRRLSVRKKSSESFSIHYVCTSGEYIMSLLLSSFLFSLSLLQDFTHNILSFLLYYSSKYLHTKAGKHFYKDKCFLDHTTFHFLWNFTILRLT